MTYARIGDTHYAADTAGQIYRAKHGKLVPLKSWDNGCGYRLVEIYVDKVKRRSLVHRLVWEAFYGAIPDGLEINHKSRDRADNRLENLELLTHYENIQYSRRLGAWRKDKT